MTNEQSPEGTGPSTANGCNDKPTVAESPYLYNQIMSKIDKAIATVGELTLTMRKARGAV